MKTHNEEKREYSVPVLDQIKFDKDVSLALESSPPDGPYETSLYKPERSANDPLITIFV